MIEFTKFKIYSLIMQSTISHQSIWSSIDEVSHLQERASCLLDLYQKFIVHSEGENQFLKSSKHHSHPSCSYSQLWQQKIEQKNDKNLECGQSMREVEEEIDFEPRKINLSRIFQDITLGDEVKSTSSTIDAEIYLSTNKFHITLSKVDNSFNLSNFSSFNNQRQAEIKVGFQLRDLLLMIQEKAGRQLSKNGIENIIKQLEASLIAQSDVKWKMQQSGITRHTLKGSQINPCAAFTARDTSDFQFEENILKESKENNFQEPLQLFYKKEHIHEINIGQKESKENSHLHYRKKKAPVPSKQIRILRKNCPKNSLLMNYTDLRHLQNFCISNKIYGKDKEKIAKAIRDGKNIVTLD